MQAKQPAPSSQTLTKQAFLPKKFMWLDRRSAFGVVTQQYCDRLLRGRSGSFSNRLRSLKVGLTVQQNGSRHGYAVIGNNAARFSMRPRDLHEHFELFGRQVRKMWVVRFGSFSTHQNHPIQRIMSVCVQFIVSMKLKTRWHLRNAILVCLRESEFKMLAVRIAAQNRTDKALHHDRII
uniref:hypothetical protein n=1 Tax=Burkholderia arboris TaxID=488730 RepID=UPI003BEECEBF